ncbi:MAG TPA: hypothetical protein VMT12_10370 [Syntrophales bacterium]|nr:hypothetical protein [Syntrophales bacterium]
MKDSLRSQFDEILGGHFERLIGTKKGIGGLPLNIATIGCFVLLGGREIEIENSHSDDIERYTRDTFLQEAADIGIQPDDYLKTWLDDMIQRGYAEIDSEGRFFTQQSSVIMARLLDRIFPKMPGINFLAYIGQTIEEAVSGRTDIGAAISRFDQTLNHHGVPVSRQKSPQVSPAKSVKISQVSSDDQQKSPLSREQILAELYSRSRNREEPSVSSSFRETQKILAGGTVLKTGKIGEILPEEEMPPETTHDMDVENEKSPVESQSVIEHSSMQDVNAQEVHCEIQAKIITEGHDVDEADGSTSLTKQLSEVVSQVAGGDQGEEAPAAIDEEEQGFIDETGEEEGVQDDDIAKKIAAFEKDLALTCPICRENVLKEQPTAAGKIYYSCPSNDCNFISWGKPHLIECKRCKNPFLVEATDKSGQAILKCPRATCQHRQGLSPKRVKVVRKRLVRRKK